MCNEIPEILADVEVGHTGIFRDGKQKQQPKCYALIADASSIMGIYTTNQPDRDQILNCINGYLGCVPEITLEDTFNTLDTDCNSELDLDSTIGSAIDELLMHNLTSLDIYNCEFTLDEFDLEVGKSKV